MNSQRHLVLRSKKTGKVASRTDQNMIALRLKAIQLSASGRGGGIVSLLLPQDERDERTLQKASARYQVVEVRKRKLGERKKVRSVVLQDAVVLAKLANLYWESLRDEPIRGTVHGFAKWVCSELKDHHSDVCKHVVAICPALADRTRPGWWEKQIANRRNRQKSLANSGGKTAS